MKKTIAVLLMAALFGGCRAKIELIGSLNMISTRNVSTKENYTQIKSYAGTANNELRRNKAKSIDEAINNTIRNTPGGEFLMNVKIYRVGEAYAVGGDVWGLVQNQNFKGFKKGDRISWKDNFVRYTGVISDLKNDKEATVIQDENNKVRTVLYEDMEKIN